MQPPPLGLLFGRAWTSPSAASRSFCLGLSFLPLPISSGPPLSPPPPLPHARRPPARQRALAAAPLRSGRPDLHPRPGSQLLLSRSLLSSPGSSGQKKKKKGTDCARMGAAGGGVGGNRRVTSDGHTATVSPLSAKLSLTTMLLPSGRIKVG